jgi:hypothetical protein
MSNAEILIPILGIMCGMIAIIANAALRAQKMKLDMMREQRVSGASEQEMMRELSALKDRVAVLEKLVTDDDRRLANDIERLRSADIRG